MAMVCSLKFVVGPLSAVCAPVGPMGWRGQVGAIGWSRLSASVSECVEKVDGDAWAQRNEVERRTRGPGTAELDPVGALSVMIGAPQTRVW
ncbi:hypothetical protein BKG67_04740 [Mycobacteroides chelonae]|nr:hypothetical protein BKG66_08145 [Mycobacteroides chelonae]OHT75915.1 hypothetical protein BKG67_04740 [Mycobacteroides chelonae]